MCQISQNQRIRVTLANKDATTGTSFVFCMFLSDMKTRDEKKNGLSWAVVCVQHRLVGFEFGFAGQTL